MPTDPDLVVVLRMPSRPIAAHVITASGIAVLPQKKS
jgi:hypothetical protein